MLTPFEDIHNSTWVTGGITFYHPILGIFRVQEIITLSFTSQN